MGNEPIPFSQLTPASSTKGASLVERWDPYWSNVWLTSAGGANASWTSPRSKVRLADEHKVPSSDRRFPYSAAEALETLPHRRKWLHALGAVNLWQTLTAQQLTAITGMPAIANSRSVTIGALWATELIQRGGFHAWGHPLHGVPELYRPDPRASKADLSHLDYQDWLGVTAGTLSSRGHQYDRHNILTTELSIRAGELCPTIAVVLGEALADWKRLFSLESNPSQARSADAVWVRDDGLRIIIETAVRSQRHATAKIRQLMTLLRQDKDGSTVVLFLTAEPSEQHVHFDNRVALRKTIVQAVSSLHGSVRSKVAGRIAIADWQDWFPAPGVVSPAFFSLTAETPTGTSTDRWQPVDLADPFSFPPTPEDGHGPPDIAAVLANVAHLYGVPHWMRQTPDPTMLEHHLLAEAGIPDEVLFDPETGAALYKPPPVFPRPQRETWDRLLNVRQRSSRVSSGRRAAASRTSKRSSSGGQQ